MNRLIIFLMLCIPFGVLAQTTTTGTVYDFTNKKLSLPGVKIKNINNKRVTSTGKDGRFIIGANVGDLLEFSAVGYHTDTLYLTSLLNRSIYLPSTATNLSDVNVKGVRMNSQISDAKDPLAEKYTRFSTGGNLNRKRMTDKVGGFGLNLGYGKYKREQRKKAELEDNEVYMQEIDQNFTDSLVTNLTALKGDELKNFMIIFRPTVSKVKSERPFKYDYYIATSFQAWKRLSPEQQKLKDLPKLEKN